MSATKHTPGPWVVEGKSWEGYASLSVKAGGRGVCAISSNIKRPGAESAANARLIAFAPVMFEALQTIANSQEHDLVGGRLTVVCDFETLRLVAEEVVRSIEEAQS